MPQSERSENIKQLLSWLAAKSSKDGGASIQQIVGHVQLEITDMGASVKTVRSYLQALERNGLIYTEGLKFKVTAQGKNWLERKFLQ